MRRRWQLFYILMVALLVAATALVAAPAAPAHATLPPPHRLRGQTPGVVVDGEAHLLSPHNQADVLTVALGLSVRDSAALDALIAAASDPSSPSYGHYLTNQEYYDRFAPTEAQAAAVRAWTASRGLEVMATSPDNLLVVVKGTTARVERAFSTTIDDYRLDGKTFRSNAGDVALPAGLAINAVSGLSTLHRPRALRAPLDTRGGGYFPRDFQAAYNTASVGIGANQTIGFTLWGAPLPQSDLTTFATHTGSPPLTIGSGASQIEFISPTGVSTDTSVLVETALDAETAHGLASSAHLKYWLGNCIYDKAPGVCDPSDAGLELAVSDAANDASLHVVSNSWGGYEATSTNDPFVANIDPFLQHAAAVGTTFYFSTGDQGAYSGATTSTGPPAPSYPADSQYVVAVGGTNLQTTASNGYSYSSETAWSCATESICFDQNRGGSGGGCSSVFSRPTWQIGVVAGGCVGRAIPDVSAAGDPATGAYVAFDGQTGQYGGTSLSAPLWAGMAADVNQCLAANNAPLMGFSAPRIYQLTINPITYSRDFHDVVSGSNGAYSAGTGWDEVTGWGSPNLANLAVDWPATGPISCTTNATASPTSIATLAASPTPLGTNAPTATIMSTPPASTPTAVATPNVGAAATPSPTASPGGTATPVSTSTAPPSAGSTAPPTLTASPSATSTASPIPTATSTTAPSSTALPSDTPVATATSAPPTEAAATATFIPPTAPPAASTAKPTATSASTPSGSGGPVALAPTDVPRAAASPTAGIGALFPTRTSAPMLRATSTPSARATTVAVKTVLSSRSAVRLYIAGGRLPTSGQALLTLGNATSRAARLTVTSYDSTGAVHHTSFSLGAKTHRTVSITRFVPAHRFFGLTIAADQNVAGSLVLVNTRKQRHVVTGLTRAAMRLRLAGVAGPHALAAVLNTSDHISHVTLTPTSRRGRTVRFTIPAHAQSVVDIGRAVSGKGTVTLLLTADRPIVAVATAS